MAEPGGYAKSAETRAAIVHAALGEFGRHGYADATTRAIASAAEVSLPSIAYHFGGKEGLYLACAKAIVARYYEMAAAEAVQAGMIPERYPDSARSRALLVALLGRVLAVFSADAEERRRADFVAREMSERGPAFDLLYDRLWRPGIEVVAQLVGGIRGRSGADETDRIDALMLVGSLLAFHTGRDVSCAVLGWDVIGEPQALALGAAIERMVAGIR